MTDVTALLQQLGFSEYEARAYLALVQRNPLNGYELAKVSGLPRANIYAVLQKLEERGAAVRLDLPNRTRYAPIAPTELTKQVATRFHQTLNGCYLYPWWIIPGPNRLSALISGDRAQLGPYQPCPLQSFSAVDSHFSALESHTAHLCERMNK